MKKAKKRGRPPTGSTYRYPITVFLTKSMRQAVEKFASEHNLKRSEAVRSLLDAGLTAKKEIKQ
jgi:hypothetical protein